MKQIIAKNFKFGLWYVFTAITCCLIFDGVAEQIYDIIQKQFGIDNYSPESDWIVPLVLLAAGVVAFFASWILYKRKIGAAVVFWIITQILVLQFAIVGILWEEFHDEIELAYYTRIVEDRSEFSFEYYNHEYYLDEDTKRLYRVAYGSVGYYEFEECEEMLLNAKVSFTGTGEIVKVYVTYSDYLDNGFYLLTADGKIYASYDYDWL
ncbi:MAG: hypothetical protein LBM41_04385 [Ruminococcus sp.]|jgi:hypothetical protein|nr:hypothetical protein [Ruminococcus sp.]